MTKRPKKRFPLKSERMLPILLKSQKWLQRTFWVCLIIAFLLFCGLFYMKQKPLPASQISQSSQLVDRNGVLIDYFHTGVNRRAVALEEISDYVKLATISIEDKRFYNHFGIDFKGLARALLVNLQAGSAKQGASTLTQQLARNLYLSHEKTLERKAKEALYTVQLEMHYSKDEILNMYLNQIYYGHGAYGIEAAANFYFNKSAKELDLAESSMLVGIPKGPTYYSPLNNMKNAKQRQKLILQAMQEHGHITEEEKEQAFAQILNFTATEELNIVTNVGYFKDYVVQEAINKAGIDEQLLYNGNITIFTTLDISMQEIAEQEVRAGLPSDSELQAALIAVDPRNGHIKAMVGGRDYAANQFNRTLSNTRQTGSTFKPFVYLTALHKGLLTPISTYESKPTIFTYENGKTYEPQNYGDHYANEPITLRQAIASSDNIYAVHAILDTGIEAVIDTTQQLGVKAELEAVPSLALGTSAVSPLEMASAYGVFAGKGMYHEPISILKIVNNEGKVLYEADYEPKQVISEAEAYLLTSLLEGVFEEGGTAHRVQHFLSRPIAGKSGTTPADAWMIGYTPELSTAVWVGYDRNRLLSLAEAHRAAPIFAQFMEKSLSDLPPKRFELPTGISTVFLDKQSGLLASAACPDYVVEYFIKGTEPEQYCKPLTDETQLLIKEGENEQQHLPQYKKWWKQLKDWWSDSP